MIIKPDTTFIKQSCTKFQINMSKHVGEHLGKTLYFQYSKLKMGLIPAKLVQSDDIQLSPSVMPNKYEKRRLHENFVIVPADKASNNYTFVCKRHYVDILIEERGLHSLSGNSTYNLTDLSASKVVDNHKSVLTSFGIQINNEELDLLYIYWIPKMHKNPYKLRLIAGSSKCVRPSLYPFYSQNCLHILSMVFRSTARQPTQEVGYSDVDPQEFKFKNRLLLRCIHHF